MKSEHDIPMIAIYGKGGIGKSVTASNISAALSQMGDKVLQVGCDPKHDSISTLCGKLVPTILELQRETGRFGRVTREDIDSRIFVGFNNVLGCESGGPRPASGCAGKGVTLALQLLFEHRVPQRFGVTFIIFDVLGDAVCGGFTQPMRQGFAREVYIVACGELLTLYMVNNLARAIRSLHDQGAAVMIGGIIDNMRGVPSEEAIVEEFGQLIGVPVIHHIPRDKIVQLAEFQGKTVIEAYPEHPQADEYRALAQKIRRNEKLYVPEPATMDQIKKIIRSMTPSAQ
jgi:nitrogenase iron protein NifH